MEATTEAAVQEASQSKALIHDGDDDWAGVADKAERRKRQNRLHQRAWRRRKALEASEAALVAYDQGKPSSGFWVLKPLPEQPQQRQGQLQRSSSGSPGASRGEPSLAMILSSLAHTSSPFTLLPFKIIPPLLRYVTDQERTKLLDFGGPLVAVFPLQFPLSPDHHLITLIQYNVLRGTITNMAILSILHRMPAECGLDLLFEQMFPSLQRPAGVPPSLQPTALQRAAPHELWIDSVPSAAMRDNLIRTYGSWDEDELCGDLLGGLYEGFNDVERRGMIVWSDPWLADGWEVTEGFARKWTFLLQGCEELLASTNRWRAQRGEEPMVADWGRPRQVA